jgi:hypothetical protein
MKILAVLGLAVLLGGCPKGGYHDAVVAEHDFTVGLAAVQQAELTEFQAGRIDAAEHQALESGIAILATAGQVLNQALTANAANTTLSADFQGVVNALQALLNSGVTGIKNAQSKQVLTVALQTINATLQNVGTLLAQAKGTS